MVEQSLSKQFKINPSQLNAYSTGLLQGKAYSRMHTLLSHTLSRFGISVPEWKLLGQLHENDKIRLSEIASLLSYDPPMVTKLVKGLEKKGLLKRISDKNDERAKTVIVSVKGNQLILEIEPEVKKTMANILKGVNREDLITYIKVLGLIVDNTEE